MGLLKQWLLTFVVKQLDAAVVDVQQADALSPQTTLGWPVHGPPMCLNKRGQVRKITSYNPDALFPITMDVSDEKYQMECLFSRNCVDAYNAARTASMYSTNPTLTTLRGALVILKDARILLSKSRSSQSPRASLVIDSFVFIGNHGCEPTQHADHIADVQGVRSRLALLAAWIDPVAPSVTAPSLARAYSTSVIPSAVDKSPSITRQASLFTVPPNIREKTPVAAEKTPAVEFDSNVDATFLGQWELQVVSDEDE
ncbi:hypothetical protein DFJ77DRAFT_351067 [Powellomyces hirtus]|nr:hypothetical protein DFJ77DRAFT_351067 [Powellomyces hirtus]